MAVKDFALRENTDLSKEEKNAAALKQSDALPEDPNPQIKNAHATGDGSYGRNDESLPEESEGKGKVRKDSSY